MHKKEKIYLERRHDKGKFVFMLFFGMLGFITIYFPLFGGTLRYQTGAAFSSVFSIIGGLCNWIGWMLMGWGLLLVFAGRIGGVVIMISGAFLLIIAGWMLNPYSIGASATGRPATPGFH